MDDKGTEEELTYPNIYFTVDNFEEVISVRLKKKWKIQLPVIKLQCIPFFKKENVAKVVTITLKDQCVSKIDLIIFYIPVINKTIFYIL